MILVLKLLCVLIFGNITLFRIITTALTWAGMYGIFKKCGIPGWHACIPYYSTLEAGRCSGREMESRVAFIAEIINAVLNIGAVFLPEAFEFALLQSAIILAVVMVYEIYIVRIYIGFCEVFGRKKRWAFLWFFAEYIPALLWGWCNKYQPQWKVPDFESAAANFFSGSKAEILDNGLTVNLEERTVSDFFKKKYLLRDIHMYIKPGRMVLLLGGSGAGKTTLLNAINGYEKAKAEVVLNGSNVYSDYKKMQYEIGFVPQQDLMRGNDTVLHTLLDAAALRLPQDFTPARRRERVDEVMGIFGLTPVQNSLVSKLSGGQRKRLSISMEFISNPSLFILDEPDSGLDGVMARALMQQLRAIADQGKIVIVITHTPDRVTDLFDDVIVLAKDSRRTGRLAYFGSIEESRAFFSRDTMEQVVRSINRKEEGGDGLADEFIMKYAEVHHA